MSLAAEGRVPGFTTAMGRTRWAACALLALLCCRGAMGLRTERTPEKAMAKTSLRAEVTVTQQGPALLVNGKRAAPLTLFINLTGGNPDAGLSTVRRAAAVGVNIVSFVCHHFPWPKPGEQADYGEWDRQIDAILQANPNALLIPRIGMSNIPGWWANENSDEMMLYDNGQRGMVSMASEKWRKEAGEMLRLLVRHLEDKYTDHMLGYHPCGQNTGEWFYDRVWENLIPSYEKPMEVAWRKRLKDDAAKLPGADERRAGGLGLLLDPANQQGLADFWAFQQDAMVEPLEHFARVIKEETKGRKLVAYFYGYTFELSALPGGPAVSGHLALERLLRCKDVDIVCSPISYSDRQPGGGGMFMAPIDSVQLHGKLWLNEDDTRTYLSSVEDGYGRAGTLDETLAVHDRNFAHIASRGAACWWMDLPGNGWLDSDEIWQNCAQEKALYQRLARAPKPYRPDIAVVVDEKSLLHLAYGNQVSVQLTHELRKELYRMGAPVGFYLLSDVCAGKVKWPKVYVFMNAIALDEAQRRALLRQVRKPGKTAIWFYAPGFIKGATASAELVSVLTGISVEQETAPVSPRAVATEQALGMMPDVRKGEEFGPVAPFFPLFYANDPQATELAKYVATGRTAAAIKQVGGGSSVFIGTLRATPGLLREIARLAGAHIYLDSDDITIAGNGIIAVHATSDGEKVLRLPRVCTLKDAFSGQIVLKKGSEIRLPMRLGETRIFVETPP